jgi:hypothetical protein
MRCLRPRVLLFTCGVSGDPDTEPSARARPVAGAPIDALLAIADELARRWAIELMNGRSLQEIAEAPVRDLAGGGPALCAGVIRALGSDFELERLLAGGPAGSRDPSDHAHGLSALARSDADARATVREVESLRAVLWEALLAELRWPAFERSTARMVVDLSDRLAYVCSAALSATLAPSADASGGVPAFTPVVEAREQVLYSSPPAADGRSAAVLVDERTDASPIPEAARPRPRDGPAVESRERFGEPALDAPEARRRAEAKVERTRPRPLPWGSPAPAAPAQPRPPREEDHDSAVGQDPVMRIRRGPAAPVDERP